MALLNAVYPDMGLGGRATGSLDFEQTSADAFPRADARLTINNFTRTTAALVSEPVDINVAGKLLPDGGEVRAVRSEEHTSELQSLMRISYAVFCLKKKTNNNSNTIKTTLNTYRK